MRGRNDDSELKAYARFESLHGGDKLGLYHFKRLGAFMAESKFKSVKLSNYCFFAVT